MSFEHLAIKRKYKSSSDELVNEFYLPVLNSSVFYQRAVGYFTSSILVDYIAGLKHFVENNGRMQLLISPFVKYDDALAFLSSTKQKEYISNSLESIFTLFRNYGKKSFKSAQLLLALIREGYLEVQIAFPREKSGLFHEKIGIFTDDQGNKIAINGSNNETDNALEHNIESFNTFCSWKSGQDGYVEDHSIDFESYWQNVEPSVKVMNLLDAINDEQLIDFDTNETITEMFGSLGELTTPYPQDFPITLRPFQSDAMQNWMVNEKGIFKFATGTGKTKTAIYLINEVYKRLGYLFSIIVVPDKTLVEQWSYELNCVSMKNIKCFSDNADWPAQMKDAIDLFRFQRNSLQIVVVTKDSFSEDKFQNQLKKINQNSIFVADEVHRLGTDNLLSKLPLFISRRLGLSATPEIYFSQSRTDRLLDYFGGIVAEYNIDEAIKNGYLVEYNYIPVFVSLDADERDKYLQITHKIVKMLGYDDESKIKELSPEAELLLFQRARIVYGAAEKLTILNTLLDSLKSHSHLLIYCGATSVNSEISDSSGEQGLNQLQSVNKLLNDKGINAAQYTQDSDGRVRQVSIESFKAGLISTLVAIRCLDEGVNIEEIQQAIILASSGNPREFIQRRGRLLRKSIGKDHADIYDMVVFVEDERFFASNMKELGRLVEFNSIAKNAKMNEQNYAEYLSKYYDWEKMNGTD